MSGLTRRDLVAGALALVMAAASGAAFAQAGKPIRILVGFPAGGGTDAIARLLSDKLKDELGAAAVVVENRPGAGGQIAAQALKAAVWGALRPP